MVETSGTPAAYSIAFTVLVSTYVWEDTSRENQPYLRTGVVMVFCQMS